MSYANVSRDPPDIEVSRVNLEFHRAMCTFYTYPEPAGLESSRTSTRQSRVDRQD